MTRAKSLLEVKDGLTFLDIIARQVLALRERSGARLPLVLMNSFPRARTRWPRSRATRASRPTCRRTSSRTRSPSCARTTSSRVEWPADPELEWAPPGHGDLYTALQTSGVLEAMLERGYRWAFVSNSDNLGAVLEPRILAWIAARAGALPHGGGRRARDADRKGGHIARAARRRAGAARDRPDPGGGLDAFQDVARHRYFNTNNLWLDLRALADRARASATG